MSFRLVLLSCALSIVALCVSPASAQHFSNPNLSSTQSEQDAFVIRRTSTGDSSCREATDVERASISQRRKDQSFVLIYGGAPTRRSQSKVEGFVESASGLTLQPSAGLHIVLHGTAQLNQNQQAKNAFIVAANRWEAVISTPITVVLDVDFGPTFFGAPYGDAELLGQAASPIFIRPYEDVRARLVATASNALEQQLYSALPQVALPVEFNGSTLDVTSVRLTVPNARALGLTGNVVEPNSVSSENGDAQIGFNSSVAFDFTPDDGISPSLIDFDSVATHEIGHALGFSSRSGGSTSTPVATMDIFRLTSSDANNDSFTSARRIMSKGGDQVLFGNRMSTFATSSLALSTGGPNPAPGDGDGRQSSHWKDDSLSSLQPYIGVMDPTIHEGLRRSITENDINALDLFGYSVEPPAPVRPTNDGFVNPIILQSNGGTFNGSNLNATREVGEPAHVGFLGDKSVWFSWTATISGQITIDTIGSNFNTTLSVYLGSTVNALSNVAQNNDINEFDSDSRVQFNIVAGNTYRIVIDGWNGESGDIRLNWNAMGVAPTPTPTPINLLDDPRSFVRQQYLDFLDREPDLDGLNFWTNEIASCGNNNACIETKRVNVSAAFFLSTEFQQTGYLVERAYSTAFGKSVGVSNWGGLHSIPVPAIELVDFLADKSLLGRDVIVGQAGWESVLENNKKAFFEAFAARARTKSTLPASLTPSQYVDLLRNNTGSSISPAERNQLVHDLTAGLKTRGEVLRAVAEDSDFETSEFNTAFVLMQYYGYLRRDPNSSPDTDHTGFDFWLSKLNQFNGNFVNADMVKAFLDSSEYRSRFVP